jgi:hypothetical protein
MLVYVLLFVSSVCILLLSAEVLGLKKRVSKLEDRKE